MKHLIDSADWSIEEIITLLGLSRRLKHGEKFKAIDHCFSNKTVILCFNKESTRSRLTFQQAIVEMGGVPILTNESDFHNSSIENLTDLAEAMAISSSAICIRLLPNDRYLYGQCENILRHIASVSEKKNQVPVISMSHDRCHPCQGLSEVLTLQNALGKNNLAGTRILVTWVRGNKARPWSPTQDSLMLFTRLGMKVTLCNPPGYDFDPDIIDKCKNNSKQSGGSFNKVFDFENSFSNQEVIYARHWGSKTQQTSAKFNSWYLD